MEGGNQSGMEQFCLCFLNAMKALEHVTLDRGAIMLGALSLVGILFADDVVLLARCMSDLQALLDAFSDFCSSIHEQIALDKTEGVVFGPKSSPFSIRDGKLYEQFSKRVVPRYLFLKQQPVKWSSFFRYLGSPISGTEWLSFLEDSVDTGVKKIRGALCSACSSAVALPMSRVVDLNQSLVSPIALLNCVAWVPFLKRGGPWFSSMCDHWWGVLGFRKEPKKEYVLLSWLEFRTWDLTAAKMLLKFTGQLVRAPPGSFLAELLAELRRECLRACVHSWLFGVLRLLEMGLSFRRDLCLVARVDSMLERIRTENVNFLTSIFTENFSARALKESRDRLAARKEGPYTRLRVLQSWVGQDGGPPPRFRMHRLPFTRASFHMLARLVLGTLPVNRIDGLWRHRSFFGKFVETWYGKRACPCCFLEHDTLVLDSEWHWIFDCVGFAEIRSKMPYLSNCLTEIRKNAVFSEIHDLGNLLNAIQNDSRLGFSTVSFLRRAISQREIFMKDSCCVRGRQGAIHSPGHWTRDLLRLPPIAAELPEEFEQSFLIGKPWFFGEHEFLTEQCILS